MKTEYGILNPIILSVYLRSNRSSVFDDMNIFREQWKLVLTGFAMSDRNNTLSRQIARTFLTKYIKQNQDLITKVTDHWCRKALKNIGCKVQLLSVCCVCGRDACQIDNFLIFFCLLRRCGRRAIFGNSLNCFDKVWVYCWGEGSPH